MAKARKARPAAQPAAQPVQPAAPQPAQAAARPAPRPPQRVAPQPAQAAAPPAPQPAQPAVAEAKFVIFFSWQSDLPDETNRRLIREGLRNASTMLEAEYAADNLRVEVDEATRNLPGSPNIPQAILNKIRAADVFIGDITTINAARPEGQRPCPNPNVMVELGYAIALLGWNRIVMLFNKAHGVFPSDVPFDIDRHRMSEYEYALPAAELTKKERAARVAELKKPLFALLYDAVKAIYVHRPPKPREADELTPEARKRRRDLETLTSALANIHIPTMDEFFERVQTGSIPRDIFHFWEGFRAVVSSDLFHLYDAKAAALVTELLKSWGASLSFGEHFMPSAGGRYYSFYAPGDVFQSGRQEKAWKELQAVARTAHETFVALLKHVRENYIEIDVVQTNKDAWIEFVEFHNEMKKRFGPIPG